MLFKGENVENSKNYLKLERFGDRIAIKSLDGKTLTYTELAHSCDVFAQRFPTDRKCLIVHAVTNERASIIALYAMLRAGHAVLLSEAGNRAHTDRLIEQYDPDFVIEGDCVTERPSTKDRPVLHPDLAWIINTSGSTGSSKGVRLSSEAIAANGRDISNYLKLTSDDCALLTLPLHYCYGLSVLNSHFRVGATVVDGLTSASDGDFEAVLRDLEVTNFPAVPYTIELLESQGFRSWDLPNLRLVTQAGGRLSPDLVTHYARWARDGASDISRDFFVMYGATEATSRMAYMTTEDALRTPDAVGRAIPNGSFEIVDEQGAPLTEAGQAGELVYRGPNLMMGYAHDRGDLSLSAEISSLQTGDIAEWTSDGLVRIVGRVSRFSKIFGKRQNLDDIEERLHRAGYSAVAVSDDRMLFLGVENAHHIDEVAQSASENFEIPAHLIAVSHVDPMPRLGSGKVDYPKLLVHLQETAGPQVSAPTTAEKGFPKVTVEQIEAIYGEVLRKKVSGSDSFRSLGGDSLSYVQASLSLERVLGHLPARWDEIPIQDLVDTAKKRASSFFIEVETSVVVRFLAIVFVVVKHSGISELAGGAFLLLFLSGYNFSRFNVGEDNVTNRLDVFRSIILNVFLPYFAFVFAFGLLKGGVDWNSLLLVSTFFGSNGNAGFLTWYVVTLIHAVLLTLLLLRLAQHFQWSRSRTAALLFLVGVVLHAVDVLFIAHPITATPGGNLTWVYWIFAIGFWAATVSDLQSRIVVAVLLFGMSILGSGDIGRQVVPFIGGALCLFVPNVTIFAWLRWPLIWISGSSLFIYMLHGRAPVNGPTADWSLDIVRILLGLAVGVIAFLAYEAVLSRAQRLLRHIRARKGAPM